MKNITKNYKINAPIIEVWECLTNENKINKWGAKPTKFEPKVGKKFNMWGDYLIGKINKIDAPKFIEEDWTVDGMDEPSIVQFELSSEEAYTTVKLTHKNIPDELEKELSEGWDEYYLGAIQKFLEGTTL